MVQRKKHRVDTTVCCCPACPGRKKTAKVRAWVGRLGVPVAVSLGKQIVEWVADHWQDLF